MTKALKYILPVLLILALLCGQAPPAPAAEPVTAVVDVTGSHITVSGTTTPDTYVTLLVTRFTDGDKSHMDQTRSGEDGSYSFSFQLPENAYRASITSNGIGVQKDFSVGDAKAATVTVRVEGAAETLLPQTEVGILEGETTLLETVQRALEDNGVEYQMAGGLINTIKGEEGWQWLLNNRGGMAGPNELLKGGDQIVLVDDLLWNPVITRLTLSSSSVRVEGQFTVTLEAMETTGAVPLQGERISFDGRQETTDAGGKVSFTAQTAGSYKITCLPAADGKVRPVPVTVNVTTDGGSEPEGKTVTVYVRVEGYDGTAVPRTPVTVDNFDLSSYLTEGSGSSSGPSTGWGPDKLTEPTVAHALIKALENAGINCMDHNSGLDMQDYGWSLYVAMIAGDREFDIKNTSGWMYRVNGGSPEYGCQAYNLNGGEDIVWYFGAYGFDTWYTGLSASKTALNTGEETTLTLTGSKSSFSGGAATAMAGAAIYVNGSPYSQNGQEVKTDASGQAALKFSAPGVYQVSAERFTAQNIRDMVRPLPLLITVGGESLPQITSVRVTPETLEPGEEKTVRVDIETESVEDGTAVDVDVLREDGSPVKEIAAQKAAVKDGKATVQFTVPASLEEGVYKIRVTCGELVSYGYLTIAVKQEYPLLIYVSPDTISNGEENYVDVDIFSDEAPEGTELKVDLVQENNSPVGSVAAQTVKLSDYWASTTLTVPAGIEEGDYKVRVTLKKSIYYADLTVTPGEDGPVTVKATPDTVEQGRQNTVAVEIQAPEANDGTELNVRLVTEGDSPVSGSAAKKAVIRNGAASATLTIPAGLEAGSYRVRVTLGDKSYYAAFTVVPGEKEALTVKVTPGTVKKGEEAAVTVEIQSAELADGTELNIALLMEDNTPVNGVASQSAVLKNGAASATLTIPGSLAAGKYKVSVAAGELSSFDYLTVKKPSSGGGGGGGSISGGSTTGENSGGAAGAVEAIGKALESGAADEAGLSQTVMEASQNLLNGLKTLENEEDATNLLENAGLMAGQLVQAAERITTGEGAIEFIGSCINLIDTLAGVSEKLSTEDSQREIARALQETLQAIQSVLGAITGRVELGEEVQKLLVSCGALGQTLPAQNADNMRNQLADMVEGAMQTIRGGTVPGDSLEAAGGAITARVDAGWAAELAESAQKAMAAIEAGLGQSGLALNRAAENTININIPSGGAARTEAVLSPGLIDQVSDRGIDRIAVNTGNATFNLTPGIFGDAARGREITLSAEMVDPGGLSRAVPAGSLVVDLGITAGGESVTSFQSPLEVSIPYAGTPANPGAVTVFLLKDDGSLEPVGGMYNPTTGLVTFVTGHLSKYLALERTKTFLDLGDCPWAAEAVQNLAGKGIISGRDENSFDPGAGITRAEFASVVVRMLKINTDNGPQTFKDIPEDSWYSEPVAAAHNCGLISGESEDRFNPLGNISREEMAAIIARVLTQKGYHGASGEELAAFTDHAEIAPWAQLPAALAVREGIIGGAGGRLAPKEKATRAEAAVMLYKLYGLIMK